MNSTILDLLKDAKYKHKFPPRHMMDQIKSTLAAKGILHSGAAVKLITKTYSESAERVLDDFVETLIRNRSGLGLDSEEVLLGLVSEAYTNVTVEARGCALSEFHDDNFKQLTLNHFNEIVSPVLDHLQRKVRLKELDLGGKMSPFQITGSQIGNLVLGSVNQSELTAGLGQIIEKGGAEAELAKALQNMIKVVGQMDADHKSEQAELLDLTKGLLQQIKLPKEERSRSTIKAVWDRLVEVSQISNEVTQIVQTVLPMIPALLGR